jgi:hypothetical protein
MRLVMVASSFISAAMLPATSATSLAWSSWFWPYEVRYFSRPRTFMISGWTPWTPSS